MEVKETVYGPFKPQSKPFIEAIDRLEGTVEYLKAHGSFKSSKAILGEAQKILSDALESMSSEFTEVVSSIQHTGSDQDIKEAILEAQVLAKHLIVFKAKNVIEMYGTQRHASLDSVKSPGRIREQDDYVKRAEELASLLQVVSDAAAVNDSSRLNIIWRVKSFRVRTSRTRLFMPW